MGACGSLTHWSTSIEGLIVRINKYHSDFNINMLKIEFKEALQDPNVNWVRMALDCKFVFSSNDSPPIHMSTENLLIFLDSADFSIYPHFRIAQEERDDIKEMFKLSHIENETNINDLLGSKLLNQLKFEIKHCLKTSFGPISYTNNDIIYYLKKLSWGYLFPGNLNIDRLFELELDINERLKNNTENDGWLETSNIVSLLSDRFTKVDLYELSKINWGGNVLHLRHYTNPFTLGFKKYFEGNVN